jgi:hypothetical protein
MRSNCLFYLLVSCFQLTVSGLSQRFDQILQGMGQQNQKGFSQNFDR